MTPGEKKGAIAGSALSIGLAGVAFYGHWNRRPWARTLTLVTSGVTIAVGAIGVFFVVRQPTT